MINFTRLMAGVGIGFALLGCGKGGSSSNVKDIYNNDEQTRRNANGEEARWVVWAGGCTGSALTERYVLTANHCGPSEGSRYTSGYSRQRGSGSDIEVVNVVESSWEFDYAILEVRWEGGHPPAEQKYSPFISTKESDLTFGRDGVATKLMTVGFPADRNQSMTYAEGYAKRYGQSVLYYNVGSINGNSGGAVWRSSDMMLVSMTNNGPHQYGQYGWDNNDPEDSDAWNWGVAMYKAYGQSNLLQDIFPNGNNRFVDDQGNLEAK